MQREMIWKICARYKFNIVGLFVNTWTADYRYPVPDCENLPFPIQIELSYKRKNLARFFIPFVEAPLNFEHFPKKEDPHS